MVHYNITVAICTYNGSQRIQPTLHALAACNSPSSYSWEIIVIDNNSDDSTMESVIQAWQKINSNISLRVVREESPGLNNARIAAFRHSKGDYLLFIDDDVTVSPNWIDITFQRMETHPNTGALGGELIASPEGPPPHWFSTFSRAFATGKPLHVTNDDITTLPEGTFLYGAALCIRRSAFEALIEKDFQFISSDVSKKKLAYGGDVELCYALQIIGFDIKFDPKLVAHHTIARHKLQWNYLTKLVRAQARDFVLLDAYSHAKSISAGNIGTNSIRLAWWWRLAACLKQHWGKLIFTAWKSALNTKKNLAENYVFNVYTGRILGFLIYRNQYRENAIKLSQARWFKEAMHN